MDSCGRGLIVAVINFKLLQFYTRSTLGALHRREELGDVIEISFNRIYFK